MYHPRVFVTFEGPEGAGKTTAIASVAAHLRELGREVLVTREPGSGELGKQIRELLLHGGEMPPQSELFLFLADRANHVETIIRPALSGGATVLCDRYADSTFVYQAIVRGLDPEFVQKANTFATTGLAPDLTLLLDLPAEVGISRIQSKDRLDREPMEFHRAVREGFLTLATAEPSRWRIVDATQTSERVSEACIEYVLPA